MQGKMGVIFFCRNAEGMEAEMKAGSLRRIAFWKPVALATVCAGVLAVSVLPGWAATAAKQPSMKSLTKVGERMPAFTVKEVSGKTFSMARERGKVVVVNFWATWCPPCRVEMPRLEKEIWDKYKGNADFVMVAIARQQTQARIAAFGKQHPEFTYPLAYDPQRAVYSKFAAAGIPRSYVVGKDGKIVFESLGYEKGEVAKLDAAVQKALKQ
jgi:peroxiredoxin